jgi:hypothetical protein
MGWHDYVHNEQERKNDAWFLLWIYVGIIMLEERSAVRTSIYCSDKKGGEQG